MSEDIGAVIARVRGLSVLTDGVTFEGEVVPLSIRDRAALLAHIDELERERDEARAWVNDLHSGMYVNCVYCGLRYGPTDKTAPTMTEQLTAHVEVCPKHPLSAAKKRTAALEGALEPFVRALNAAEGSYPGMPDEMSVMRKSFDYPTRTAGMNNDEIVSMDSVRVGDLRRSRTLLTTEKTDAP